MVHLSKSIAGVSAISVDLRAFNVNIIRVYVVELGVDYAVLIRYIPALVVSAGYGSILVRY